jgi:putative transposase
MTHTAYGTATAVRQKRKLVLRDAFLRHPNRFKQRQPQPPELPTSAGINMPKPEKGGEEKNLD